jgi:TonB family protein
MPFWSWVEGAGPSAFKNEHFVALMEPIYQVPPKYPSAARANHIEGVVVLRAIIDKEGKVKTLELIQGDPRLVEGAKAAVKQWRFKPATIGGSPAEADTNVSVVFQLCKK